MDFSTLITGDYSLSLLALLGFIAIVFPWSGKRGDTSAVDSLYGKTQKIIEDLTSSLGNTHILLEHIHSIGKLYPKNAEGTLLTDKNDGGASPRADGAITEIVPAGTITAEFDIHHVSIESISAVDVYELALYSGPALSEVEIARVLISKTAVQDAQMEHPIMTPLLAANTRISGSIASVASSGKTIRLRVQYHTY